MSKAKKMLRSDADYCRLDDAHAALADWREEILNELAKQGHSWKSLDAVMRAIQEVHSPSD